MIARRGALVAFAVCGFLAAAGGGLLLATSDHLVDPLAYGIQVALMVVGTVGAALYWLVWRPGNRLGPALLALALATLGLSLQGASQPVIHSIGVLADAFVHVLIYYAVFIFPQGRLAGRLEKAVLAGVLLYFLVGFAPWFLFSPVISGGAPLAGCNELCPPNGLMIADRPSLAAGFGTDISYVVIAALGGALACFAYRLATASRPRKRALVPVYIPAVMLTVPVLANNGVFVGLVHLDPDTLSRAGWVETVGYILFPYGFLLAVVQAAFFAAAALKKIGGQLGTNPSSARLRAILAEALDDPSLELAFDVRQAGAIGDLAGGFFVDSRGDPCDPMRVGAAQSATALERHGSTVAYIVHDTALETDPELVQAAGHSVLLALESGRLEAELQSQTAELLASRGRIVAASEAERRKIERDLHDGAQQRLMAIQVKLELLRSRIDDPEIASRLEEIADDATAAVADLRGLAHGIYPAVLRERGLGDALRAVARTAVINVDVIDPGIGRCAPAVEAAVYFCAIEAIQNATKHAGPGTHLTISLGQRDDDVVFAFVDDGVGFDPLEATGGVGLASIRDRIGAVGGEVEVTSTPGEGTAIRGGVPRAAPVVTAG